MSDFFSTVQAAAVLKHGILRRYLPIFVSKTGSFAGEVVYLDGYAGPGVYNDGSPGSPALALRTADAVANNRGRATLHGHLVEDEKSSVDTLRSLLASHGADWDVHHGRIEDLLPAILDQLNPNTPLFAFIDPFGLPIPFDMVLAVLARGGRVGRFGRTGGAATEVLLNFSVPGINRVGGQLTGKGTNPTWLRARDTMVARMDDVLGGDWWQEIWRSEDPNRVSLIRAGYKNRLCERSGYALFDVPVSDRWKGPASYHLLQLTQHRDGIWKFNESLSLAMEEYRQYCHAHEGLLDLEPLAERELQWIAEITENLARLLQDGTSFTPVSRITEVFGAAFGQAREKHLRKAIEAVRARNLTTCQCRGVSDLSKITIRPAHPVGAES